MNNLNFQMLRIRKIEEAIANHYTELKMRTPVHLDIGAEWVSVAVCRHLEPHDAVFGGHRSHSQYLACGGDLKALIAELYGKSTGCCGGRGGSMHLQTDGIFKASTSIVGGTIPLAVGAALAKKLKKEAGIVVCFLGDGATEEGVFGEALNFASLHELPILFVVQNNKLAVTTPINLRHKYDVVNIANAYGLDARWCIGDTITEASEFSRRSVNYARSHIPQLIEFCIERQRVHCGMEHEFELVNDFVKQGTHEEELAIQKEIEEAFKFAEEF